MPFAWLEHDFDASAIVNRDKADAGWQQGGQRRQTDSDSN